MTPKVTIGLSIFNGAATLQIAIRSILFQTYKHWELLLIDDGSLDNSLDIAREFADPRIHVISDGKNKGHSARLNMLVDAAQGKYFARMDQDDICFPERIRKQVEYLEKYPEVDLLATSVFVFKGNGDAMGYLPVDSNHDKICSHPWSGFYMPHPTWMGRIEWFRKYRYKSFADMAEDQHLLFRSYKYSHFACLSEPYLGYRDERRKLLKMFKARFVFSKALCWESITQWQIIMAFKILIIQFLKAIGDILNLLFGISKLRNKLMPLDKNLSILWTNFLQEVQIPHEK